MSGYGKLKMLNQESCQSTVCTVSGGEGSIKKTFCGGGGVGNVLMFSEQHNMD